MKNLQLTERDLEIFRTINSFGYIDIHFISECFNMQRRIAYRRLKKLLDNNFLEHQFVLKHQPGVYMVTMLATGISQDEVPPIKEVKLATFEHTIKVAHLSTALLKKFGGEFIPERIIRHEIGIPKAGTKHHISDGILELPDKLIAIEVELTTKGTQRLKRIISHYRKNFQFQEVWYFYDSNEVRNKLQKIAGDSGIVKCFDIKNFIQNIGEPPKRNRKGKWVSSIKIGNN